MSSTTIEDMLISIFSKCDVNECGAVEINTLLDYLTSQNPSWQGNEEIREEFSRLFSCCESSNLITKEHFIRSLLNQAETLNGNEEIETNREINHDVADGKHSSSSSSGIGESKCVTPASSTSSIEEHSPTVYYVSEAQTMVNESVSDDISIADSNSPRVSLRLVAALEDEVNSLQRKIDYLESANSSLVAHVSILEENVAKNEKEREEHSKRFANSVQVQDMYKQKQEEAEEKLNVLLEENKSITIQLSHSERENSKLKESIIELEKQVECTSSENIKLNKKNQEVAERLKSLTANYDNTQKELTELQMKSQQEKETLEKMLEQNINLNRQLESDVSLVQDLKLELSTMQREMSSFQNEKIKSKLQPTSDFDELSPDNSRVFFDANFTLDGTIPFETSLLAELKDKECSFCCVKDLSFSSSSSISVNTDFFETADAAVSTSDFELLDTAMACGDEESGSNLKVKYRDVGVNCNIKKHTNHDKAVQINYSMCNPLKKRPLRKWVTLGFILLLLCFMLGFFFSRLLLLYTATLSPSPYYCLSTFIDYLHSSRGYPNFLKPVF